MITFNEQEIPNSPFLITVDLPKSDHDDVDSPGNELTRKLTERKKNPLEYLLYFLALANDQPIYENLMQRDTIIYERQDTAEIKITNLDGEDDDIILHEDHIYYAHVSLFFRMFRFFLIL